MEKRLSLRRKKGLFFYKFAHMIKNPWLRILFIVLVIFYIIFPIDLFPDFFFPVGYIDDILIVLSLVAAILVETKNIKNS